MLTRALNLYDDKVSHNHNGPARGHGVAVFDQNSGKLVQSVTCDTYSGGSQDELLANYLSRIGKDKIIVIVGHGSAQAAIKTTKVLKDKYAWTINGRPGLRESFIFVGSSNGPRVWTYSEKRGKGKGPLKRDILVPLLRRKLHT